MRALCRHHWGHLVFSKTRMRLPKARQGKPPAPAHGPCAAIAAAQPEREGETLNLFPRARAGIKLDSGVRECAMSTAVRGVKFPFIFIVLVLFAPALAGAQGGSSGTPIEIVPNVRASAQSFALSPDMARLATGEFNGEVKLWDFATGRLLRTFPRHAKSVQDLMFLADGNQILSAAEDMTVKLWDSAAGRLLREVELKSPAEYFWAIKLSPDGKRALTAQTEKGEDSNGLMKLWELDTGRVIRTFRTNAHGIAFSPDGRRVVSQAPSANYACTGQIAVVWDANTGRQLQQLQGHSKCSSIDRVAFSSDVTRLATSASDKVVRLWNLATAKELFAFNHPAYVREIAYSADGAWILTSADDNQVRLWNASSGQLVKSFKRDGFGFTNALAFLPDGKRALSSYTVISGFELWSLPSGEPVRQFGDRRNCCGLAVFMSDSTQVIFGGDKVHRWDAGSGSFIEVLDGFGVGAYTKAFTRDAKHALWWLPDGSLRITEASTGRVLGSLERSLRKEHKHFTGLALSEDGTQVLSSRYDQPVSLWDAKSGTLVRTFARQNIYSVAFSPDGKRALLGDSNGTIELLELSSGRQVWS